MKFKSNLAYSQTNVQRKQHNKINQKIHIGRIYRSKVRVRLKFYIFSIVAAAAFLSIFILSLVKCNEINANLNSVKKQIQLQKSYNIMLKTKLEQTMNIQKIEKYAKENLHMNHLNNSQINYIKTNSGNKVELPTAGSAANAQVKPTLLNKLLNKLKKMVNAE